MSKRCEGCDGKKKPTYCSECYIKERDRMRTYKKKLRNRNHLLLVLLSLVILTGTIPHFFMSVDEDAFCQEKVSKYFPEYKFESIYASGDDACVGEYAPKGEVRDGLRVMPGEDETNEKLPLQLINAEDLAYVHQDDFVGWIAVFAAFFGLVGLYITIENWLE